MRKLFALQLSKVPNKKKLLFGEQNLSYKSLKLIHNCFILLARSGVSSYMSRFWKGNAASRRDGTDIVSNYVRN